MKRQLLMKSMAIVFLSCFVTGLMAQEDIIFDPSQLQPDADSGYYLVGVDVDENNDGVLEHHDGCEDYYGDRHHFEFGTQQDFTYDNCMIMPTCYPKDCYPGGVLDPSLAEIDHPEGFIELTKSKYYGTDSADVGYIISPPIKNLVSMNLELSPDVSSNDSRRIKFWVEISKDDGETWEETPFIEDETRSKKGDLVVYGDTAQAFSLEFNDMINASQAGPIRIRVMSLPSPVVEQPQRVKVHYLKIVAERVVISDETVLYKNPAQIRVIEHTISAINETIDVFSLSGQMIGFGKAVEVPHSGIYIARTSSGIIHKVYVK